MMKKLPQKITDEELLALLETTPDNLKIQHREEIEEYTNNVTLFLASFNIQPGRHLVHDSVLYELYKRWTLNPVIKSRFNRSVGKYLLPKYSGSKTYYLINFSAFTINSKTFKELSKRSRKPIKSKNYHNHFQSFLDYYKINKGNLWVPINFLFYLYDKWCYNNSRKQPLIGEKNFRQFCKLFFPYKETAAIMWVKVYRNFYEHLTKEEILQLQEGLSRIKYAKKKNKEK